MDKRQQVTLCTEMIEAFRNYLYERENAPSTVRKYVSDVRTLYQFLDGRAKLDKQLVVSYKQWLVCSYAPSSVNSMLAALNQFLTFLGAENLKVKRLRLQKQLFLDKEKEMTRAEYQRLTQTAVKNGKVQLCLAIETLAVTGARVSELMFFTVEQVKRGKIEILNKGKRRVVLLAKGLREELLHYAASNAIKSGPIFVTKGGRAKDRSNLWREMKCLGKEARVNPQKIFPHNLRHLFARTYYKSTKDLAGLADILGHSSMDVTRIYTAETGDAFIRQIERMGLLLEKR